MTCSSSSSWSYTQTLYVLERCVQLSNASLHVSQVSPLPSSTRDRHIETAQEAVRCTVQCEARSLRWYIDTSLEMRCSNYASPPFRNPVKPMSIVLSFFLGAVNVRCQYNSRRKGGSRRKRKPINKERRKENAKTRFTKGQAFQTAQHRRYAMQIQKIKTGGIRVT